jgi:hypothetical protein
MAWEDYRAGMYNPSDTPAVHVDEAFELLTDSEQFAAELLEMLADWPVAAENWLSRPGAKSRSWLGAATCMHAVGAPQACVRTAWWLLSQDQRDQADGIADQVRVAWLAAREENGDA